MTLGKKIIIISASSDIGTAMCLKYIKEGWRVFGTYKTETPRIDYLERISILQLTGSRFYSKRNN